VSGHAREGSEHLVSRIDGTEEVSIMKKPVCVVVGIGPGNGAAIARRFSAEGYAVALLARSGALSAALAGELDDA
jgi:NAD(P)-dependent dehydrogenase (short-subunit alcohol dehydrogenase family)